MSDEDGFLRAIDRNPDDHACRLVYADWLDERCDPRGEFLRLTCRLAELRDRIDPVWQQAVRDADQRTDCVRLASGRVVSMVAFRQFSVYAGLLEGLPTRDMNERHLNEVVAVERARRPHAVVEPLLIRPEQRPIEYRSDRPYPFGEPASLPGVGCVGRFRSYTPARDPGESFSELTVIWFQDDFAPPIGREVWPRLRAIEWERYAADYSD